MLMDDFALNIWASLHYIYVFALDNKKHPTLFTLFVLGHLCELQGNYTEQNDKRNTFVFAPIFHELNSKI